MNAKLARYILDHYVHLLTPKEAAAVLHHRTILELSGHNQTDVHYKDRKALRERGLLSKDLEVLTMLSQGYERFQLKTAQRILDEHPGLVDVKFCTDCGDPISGKAKDNRCEDCHSLEAAGIGLLRSLRI
jgi:hypothetical protein